MVDGGCIDGNYVVDCGCNDSGYVVDGVGWSLMLVKGSSVFNGVLLMVVLLMGLEVWW